MSDAQKIQAEKGVPQAVEAYQKIAALNPTRGKPWSYIAKLDFNDQKYGQAIVAADEALSRDPSDFVAKSVRAVGGLRIALQSLADLKSDALLAGNARSDAVALAAAMRETLGEDVLFPENARPHGAHRARPRHAAAPAADAAPAPAGSAAGADAPTPPRAAAPTVNVPAVRPPSVPAVPAVPAAPRVPDDAQQRAPNPFGGLLTKPAQ